MKDPDKYSNRTQDDDPSNSSAMSGVVSSHMSYNPEEYIDTYITVPPDGGWGWVIVIVSFLSNFLTDGTSYTFGLFLNDISKTFETEKTAVALASSLMSGFYFLIGPVSCALVNLLGFQVPAFIGGMLTATALFFSTYTSSLHFFVALLGLVGGSGFGFLYVPSIVVIGFYFEKWRALATSIAVTGSAAGIVGFPILIEHGLSAFEWQTKFKIMAALYFSLAFLTLLYVPLKPRRVLTNKDKKVVQYLSGGDATSFGSIEEINRKQGLFKKIYNRFHNVKYPTHAQLYKDSTYLMFFPTNTSSSSIFVDSIGEGSVSYLASTGVSKTYLDARSDRMTDKLSTVMENEEPKCRCCPKCNSKCGKSRCRRNTNRPMYRDDIFFGGSLYTLPEYTMSKIPTNASKPGSMDYTLSVTRVSVRKVDEKVHFKCCPESVLRTLVTMLNVKLLKSPSFLCLAMSGYFTVLGLYAPFIYLVERAEEVHIGRENTYYLYLVLGIFNGLGRIFSGILSSMPKANALLVSYVSLSLCGLSVVVSYFLTNFFSHIAFSAVFGLTIACFSSLRAPIIVDLLGLENLTNAFGLLLLFMGVAAFMGVPLAGKIVQLTGSFNMSFVFSGCVIMMSGILLIPIKRIAASEKSKLNAEKN